MSTAVGSSHGAAPLPRTYVRTLGKVLAAYDSFRPRKTEYEYLYAEPVDTPYGPHKITGNRQLALPKELADRLHLDVGDRVYFLANPDLPGTVLIVPVEMISMWLSRGRGAVAEIDGSRSPS